MSKLFPDFNVRTITPFDITRLAHIPMEVTEGDGAKLYWKELNGELYIFDYKSGPALEVIPGRAEVAATIP